MTGILFILKIAGVLISGGTTLVALFRSKSFEEIEIPSPIIGGPTRIERRITREGKISAALAIVGIVTSLLAQIIEQSVNNRRNTETQAATSNQLRRAEESLSYLERLGTRFETLSFSVTYKLKTNNLDFTLLKDFFSQVAPNKLTNLSPTTISKQIPSKGWLSQALTFFGGKNASTSSPSRHATYSSNTVGYASSRFGTNIVHFVFGVSDEGKEHRFTYSENDLLADLALFNTNSLSKISLEFLYKPHVLLALVSEKSTTPSESDLAVLATNLVEAPHFIYRLAEKDLCIEWTFRCPKADWDQNKLVSSLPDLANATVYLWATNGPQASIMPVHGTVTFDQTTLILTNFTEFWTGWSSCTLPNKKEILGRQ